MEEHWWGEEGGEVLLQNLGVVVVMKVMAVERMML